MFIESSLEQALIQVWVYGGKLEASSRECGCSELVTPRCASVAILASGSRGTSAPPFNFLEELELGTLPIIREYSHNLFFAYLYMAGQFLVLFIKHLLFLSFCDDTLTSLTQNVFVTMFPFCLQTSCACGVSDSLTYVGFPYMCVYSI